jgi:hypothetical protein
MIHIDIVSIPIYLFFSIHPYLCLSNWFSLQFFSSITHHLISFLYLPLRLCTYLHLSVNCVRDIHLCNRISKLPCTFRFLVTPFPSHVLYSHPTTTLHHHHHHNHSSAAYGAAFHSASTTLPPPTIPPALHQPTPGNAVLAQCLQSTDTKLLPTLLKYS